MRRGGREDLTVDLDVENQIEVLYEGEFCEKGSDKEASYSGKLDRR